MSFRSKRFLHIVVMQIAVYNYLCTAFAYNGKGQFESSNLPIVVIDTKGRNIPEQMRITAELGMIWNGEGARNYLSDPFNEYDGRIEIELHGKSSLSFPKKSFRFETQDSLAQNKNLSLLGMPEENDWILYAPYSDKTLMRNALSYTLAAGINDYAPRVRFCELVLNGFYEGVYVLTENIKRDANRVDIAEMLPEHKTEPEITGGYIFKKDKSDAGDNIIRLSSGQELIIIEPKKNEIIPEQTEWLITYLDEFETVLYSGRNYDEYIDVLSFVDNFLIVELTKNIDGYRLSTYYHKDRNGKIIAGPVWDYNLSLGNADYNDGWTPIGWYYTTIGTWGTYWFDELIHDHRFIYLSMDRWKELRKDPLHSSRIFSLVDEWTELLREAQERNFVRWRILGRYVWPNPGFPESGSYGFQAPKNDGPDTWDGELQFMKEWIRGRLEWMDEQLGLSDTSVPALEPPESFALKQNYPNPFNASTQIRFDLPERCSVELVVYNTNGEIVVTPLKRLEEAGEHQVILDGTSLPSGIYFYKIRAGEFFQVKKCVLVK